MPLSTTSTTTGASCLARGRELLRRHQEVSVAGEADDVALGVDELRGDRGGEPVAHRAGERRELRPVAAEDVEAVRPDGEVAGAAREDRVGPEPRAERCHHPRHLDGAGERPRPRASPRYAACAASSSSRASARRAARARASASAKRGPDDDDPERRLVDPADLVRVGVDVDRAPARRRAGRSSRSRPSRCPRGARRRRAARRRRGGGRWSAGSAPSAEMPRVAGARRCRRSPGSARPPRRGCRSPRTTPRAPRPAAALHGWPPTIASGRSARCEQRPRRASRSALAGAACAGGVGRGVGHVGRLGEHVLGQREHDRARAARRRDPERARRQLGDALDLVDLRDPLRRAGRTCAGSRSPGTPRARRASRGIWPTRSTSGVPSWKAVWTPTDACVAPGPRVTRQIPGAPVSFPYASAIVAAPASCRHVT